MILVCLHYDLEGQGYKLFPMVEYVGVHVKIDHPQKCARYGEIFTVIL